MTIATADNGSQLASNQSAGNEKSVFELRKVSKSYKFGKTETTALHCVDLKLLSGDFLCIAGPSGSGKTTLLNILGCLDVPDNGEVIIDNQLILPKQKKDLVELRKNIIGFIFQNFNLIPVLSVYENVEYPLTLQKVSANKRKRLVTEMLEKVGLGSRSRHYPNQLSGGESQRVSIARALVKKPKLIIADEPTANLDSGTGRHILEFMKELNREENITFVFATHDSELMELSDQILHLRDGIGGQLLG